MTDRREQIIGKNEALFRAVNERIEDVSRVTGDDRRTAVFLCECGNPGCVADIEMTFAEYEDIRAEPTLFASVKGHDAPDVDEVVEERERYNVVRKRAGGPATLARETDPRG